MIREKQVALALKLLTLNAAVKPKRLWLLPEVSCLELALKNKLFVLLKPLLLAGDDPNKPNKENITALTMANDYDAKTRLANRFNLFSHPVYINMASLIAEVETIRAAAAVPDEPEAEFASIARIGLA